ncbi:DUF2993 domain-containing protein [Pseudoclavibacter chungangensis]|uniref:DUF2993 domain-containing protein n=1 Tax=Pseudoclavibacter chungangensis TaxID=587635 RepID=A0A7J5BTV6_9MICO|nr:DUF2993 domain-containing protein [Pseudoclavibacter chungangensis]KAB1657331.1 DUF2993 domain-containing protein [Pseudoclavibacter chungangensis]NYJ66213.1 hypothetical protein [Pseudoclavibacter chungangensis]
MTARAPGTGEIVAAPNPAPDGAGDEKVTARDGANDPRPPRRRWHPLVKLGVVLACIIAGLVLVDVGARLFVQWRISQSVEESMPEGTSGEVQTSVGGFSALWQLANRHFDHVQLHAPQLAVAGITIDATVDAYGVSVADGVGVEQLTGSVTLSQDSLNALVPVPGATGGIVLGDGDISYATAVDFLGTSYTIDVAAQVHVEGDRLIVQATKLQLVGGPVNFDATSILPNASTVTVPICSASYLPPGIHLSGVEIAPGTLTVRVTATTIALDEQTLSQRGTCR